MHGRFTGKTVAWLIKAITLLAERSGFGCFQKHVGKPPSFFIGSFCLLALPIKQILEESFNHSKVDAPTADENGENTLSSPSLKRLAFQSGQFCSGG